VKRKIEKVCPAVKRLRAIESPNNVEWEIAEPIKAFFRAIKRGEINPQVKLRKRDPIRA
jgi:hypothetical protein